jgi:uncharacterized Ntn-hydrolase superfamily protein
VLVLLAGRGFAARANIMVSDQTVKNMADAFQRVPDTVVLDDIFARRHQ